MNGVLIQTFSELAEHESESELQFSAIDLNPDYRQQWNEHMKDFVVLTKNGSMINSSLYRIGALGRPDTKKDKYFMVLKYIEDVYPDNITTDPKRKNHLESRCVIVDRNGVEKLVCEPFKSCWLIKNSCLYTINQHYYNIETGEFYCNAQSTIESKEYLFIKTGYGTPPEKQGVMKVHKETGVMELFY